jgi:hypothetical protein
MAKAKKTESTGAAKDSASPAAPKKKAAKSKAPTAAPATPLIDTGLAAENAAKMVFAKVAAPATTQPSLCGAAGAGSAPKETAAFKNLKANLNKPASSTMSNFLDKTAGGGKQVGRNQTFGADVNRAGVPRRTGGG